MANEADLHREHVGDGVYLAFRNGQIEVAVGSSNKEPVVYFDWRVAERVRQYIDRVFVPLDTPPQASRQRQAG